MNVKAWESLPKEYQAIFEAACAEAHVDMQAMYDSRNPAALRDDSILWFRFAEGGFDSFMGSIKRG